MKIKQSIKIDLFFEYEVSKEEFDELYPDEEDIKHHLNTSKLEFAKAIDQIIESNVFFRELEVKAEITDGDSIKEYIEKI